MKFLCLCFEPALRPPIESTRVTGVAHSTSFIVLASPRPKSDFPRNFASICVQNRGFYRLFWRWEASKANCINRVYGAGDGNRTHVRILGWSSTYRIFSYLVDGPGQTSAPGRGPSHRVLLASLCGVSLGMLVLDRIRSGRPSSISKRRF